METDFAPVTTHSKNIKHILVIEDSPSLATHLKENLDAAFPLPCDVAHSELEAKEKIGRKRYDLIITDLYLPDNSNHFVEDLVKNKHRVIVITGKDDQEKRSEILSMPIVDYVIKSDAKTLVRYLIKTVERLNQNRHTTIGICDDSKLSRQSIIQLLEPQNLGYIEFGNGEEAYHCINDAKIKVDILLTDYEMPKMDGLDLIRHLRHSFYPEDLPIISLSASDKPNLLVQFLKGGANDYVRKPLVSEEFLVRLNLTLDHLYTTRQNNEILRQLKQAASHDFMTQLYNRKHYFSIIEHLTSDAVRQNRPYGILMIDIDHFKKVNDTYGHHAGDVAIQHLAAILKKTARTSDYCFRWGGEEFLVLVPTTDEDELHSFAERLRQEVQVSIINIEELELSFYITISVGGAVGIHLESEILISKADDLLYDAKESGRNCSKIATV